MIIDECGFPRVRTRTYLPSHLVCHEPFVYPHECDQVFFVEDQINPGWSLVKKVDPRSKPVVYKGIPASSETGDSVANEIEIGNPRFGVDKASGEPVQQTAGLSVEFVDEEVDSARRRIRWGR